MFLLTSAKSQNDGSGSANGRKEEKEKVSGSPASGARRRPGMMAGGMMKSKMSLKNWNAAW